MKQFHRILFAALVSLLVVGMVGCKRKPKGPTPIPGARAGIPGGSDQFQPMPGDRSDFAGESSAVVFDENPDFGAGENIFGAGENMLPSAPREGFEGMREDGNIFADNTVYFDFDRSNIKSDSQSRVEEVATYLQSNPNDKLRVEGHCDERGTDSYNLALGERRAQSVRELLQVLGIDPNRVQTISFGEARPADPGTSEAAYARNRRAEFILLLPN